MIKFLAPLTFLMSFAALAECGNKIDPSKVVLFVDTNFSEQEIKFAEEGACARGERLVVIPKERDDFNKLLIEKEAAVKAIEKNNCDIYEGRTPKCNEYITTLDEKVYAILKFRQTQKEIKKQVDDALNELKKSNSKVQSIAISGHNGGGQFHGEKGDFTRPDLEDILKKYPTVNDIKSVLLLGCYSNTQNEVIHWKSFMPNLRLIGGYDGIAPAYDKPSGHKYIRDLLSKEKSLIANSDQKKLTATLKSELKGMEQLYASIYFQCSDGSSIKEYYYGLDTTTEKRNVSEFKAGACISKQKEMQEIVDETRKYATGELEYQGETHAGPLRSLYNRARALEHCSEFTQIYVDPQSIFNLLFAKGIKESFAEYYKEDLLKAAEYLKNVKGNFWLPTDENLKKHSRKEILENITNLHKAVEGLATKNPSMISKMMNQFPGKKAKKDDSQKAQNTLKWVADIMGSHFYQNINPFSWHELKKPVEPPRFPSTLADAINKGVTVNSSKVPGSQISGGFVGGTYGGAFGDGLNP